MKLSDIGKRTPTGAIVSIMDFLYKSADDDCWTASQLEEKLNIPRATINRMVYKIPLANRVKLSHDSHVQWIMGSEKAIKTLRKRLEAK